jgi:predicted outer membrane repeat protein
MKNLLVVAFLLGFILPAYAVYVEGNLELEGAITHSSAAVQFRPIDDSGRFQEVYPSSNGNYTAVLNSGSYNVFMYAQGFQPVWIRNISLTMDSVLEDQTLAITEIDDLFGYIDGELPAGSYHVTSDLIVDVLDTLVLHPGVQLYFDGGVEFIVFGTIQAVGTAMEPIVMTADNRNNHWAQIYIYRSHPAQNPDDILSHCSISFGGVHARNTVPDDPATLYLENSYVFNNGYTAITLDQTTILELTNCEVSGNYHGVLVEEGGTVVIEDCEFFENEGSAVKGFTGASINIDRCEFRNNVASSGAAIYLDDIAVSLIRNSRFIGNMAGNRGGAIVVNTNNLVIDHCLFQNNSAGEGGAISCQSENAQCEIRNCTFDNNLAGLSGNAIDVVTDQIDLLNCIFTNHESPTMFFDHGASVQYSTFFGNSDPVLHGLDPVGFGEVIYTNNNGDPCDVYQNLFVDPMYADPFFGDFSLVDASPCIDAGDPDSQPDPDDTIADMGAFAYDQGPFRLIYMTLTTDEYPPIMPAEGGTIVFDATVRSEINQYPRFQAWSKVVMPNGNSLVPVDGPFTLYIHPGERIYSNLTLDVPSFAPEGQYTYRAMIGTFPTFIATHDQFAFVKEAGALISGGDQWTDTGWEQAAIDQTEMTSISDMSIPTEFRLDAAYPNPFNAQTTLRVHLPSASHMRLTVYDVLGRTVAKLVNDELSAGSHNFNINGANWSSGLYFVELNVPGKHTSTQKLVLIK